LSDNSRKFIENSKKQGMRFYFAQGTLRDDWVSQAIEAVLDGSQVKVGNKNYLIQQLNIMVDILIGEPLRRNNNITDAQYQELMGNIKKKIQFIVELKCLPRM
jgi:hypothetical protein